MKGGHALINLRVVRSCVCTPGKHWKKCRCLFHLSLRCQGHLVQNVNLSPLFFKEYFSQIKLFVVVYDLLAILRSLLYEQCHVHLIFAHAKCRLVIIMYVHSLLPRVRPVMSATDIPPGNKSCSMICDLNESQKYRLFITITACARTRAF